MPSEVAVGDIWYRATLPILTHRSGGGLFGFSRLSAPYVCYERFKVARTTPKGVWLGPAYAVEYSFAELKKEGQLQWLSYKTNRARSTKQAAWEDLLRRTTKYVSRCEHRLECAKVRLYALENGTAADLPGPEVEL